MLELIRPFLSEHIRGTGSDAIINVTLLVGIAAASVAVFHIARLLLKLLERFIRRSTTTWDDDLINHRFLRAVAQLAPAIAIRWLIPGLFGENADEVQWLSALTSLYIVWAGVYIIIIFIGNLFNAFLVRPHLRPYAVKGIFQTFKLIFIGIGVIIGISILINKSPLVIIGALGASAAVLMLVFQDTILGLVASVQLSANKMLQRGDWIEDKSHDVNGEVLEISLTAVKVKNWDNSVSTVPPYALIKGSFRNYQPMKLSGGRRVQRAIYIDVNTVRFCTADELAALKERGWLEGMDVDAAAKVVNLQLLRAYLLNYLTTNAEVNHSMTCMVRQLDPTPSGLPLELYFFLSTVEWTKFESLASDIFDHVYASVQLFGLSIFQTPAGTDLGRIK